MGGNYPDARGRIPAPGKRKEVVAYCCIFIQQFILLDLHMAAKVKSLLLKASTPGSPRRSCDGSDRLLFVQVDEKQDEFHSPEFLEIVGKAQHNAPS